eukprot:gene5019-7018_t
MSAKALCSKCGGTGMHPQFRYRPCDRCKLQRLPGATPGAKTMRGQLRRWTMTAGCGEIFGEDGRSYFIAAKILHKAGLGERKEGDKYPRVDTVIEEKRMWIFEWKEQEGFDARDPAITKIWRGPETTMTSREFMMSVRGTMEKQPPMVEH